MPGTEKDFDETSSNSTNKKAWVNAKAGTGAIKGLSIGFDSLADLDGFKASAQRALVAFPSITLSEEELVVALVIKSIQAAPFSLYVLDPRTHVNAPKEAPELDAAELAALALLKPA